MLRACRRTLRTAARLPPRLPPPRACRRALPNVLDPATYQATRLPFSQARTLPAHVYWSEDFHAAEVTRLLEPSWVLAGRTEELTAPGSFLRLDLPGGTSGLIIRGKDGVARAWANVCTHRGSVLVREAAGIVKGGIVCPYHAWTFDPTSGALRGIPKATQMPACFDKAQWPLRPLRLEEYRGFLFLTASDATPSLAQSLGNVGALLSDWPLEQMVCVGRREYEVACNWKFLMQNTSETYHTSYVHRDSLGPMPSASIAQNCGIVPAGAWDGVHVPGERSIVPLPAEAAPFPNLPTAATTYFISLFPTLQLNVTRDCAWWMRVLPSGVRTSRVTLGFLFPTSTTTMPNFDELLAPYLRRWDLAVREDNDISELQQVASNNPNHRPGHYHGLEFAVHRFDNYVLDAVLGDASVPRSTLSPLSSLSAAIRPPTPAGFLPARPAGPRRHAQARAFSSTVGAARRFEGRVAVVTGAGRDIGAATARRFAAEGAAVLLHYNASAAGAEATAAEIIAAGGMATTVAADLTSLEGAAAVSEAANGIGEYIHVLVHNSGGLVARRPLDQMDAAFVHHVLDLNFTSLVLVAQQCVPRMPAGSSIVTLSSQAARDGGGPGASAYAAAKGAVHTYTRSLAKELGDRGIRVNAVSPGMIATKFHDDFTKPEVRKHVANMTQAKREGSAEEVAATIAFLASDDAAYITGAVVDVNGGLAFSA